MDVEELKMILETIELLGGDAKQFGIWYLLVGIVPNILLFSFGCFSIACIFRVIKSALVINSGSYYALADKLGIKPSIFGWRNRETKLLADRVDELLKLERSSQCQK